jgi:hypothetical protein
MKRRLKLYLLAALTITAFVIVWSIRRIPQSVLYHHFCDERSIWGIPVIGIAGLFVLRRSQSPRSVVYSYFFLFTGILLTGFGSAYYHWAPDNNTLIWDRLPMTIVFMSLLAAVVGEAISAVLCAIVLGPLLAIGTASVIWWHYTELSGSGDLRLYVLVQYYPMILIPTILLLFPSPVVRRGWLPLLWAFAWYAIAKVVEFWDCDTYANLGFISGHSLKHLAAAASTWWLLRRFRRVAAASASY